MLFTDQELDSLAKHLPEIEAWTAAIRKEITKRLQQGVEFDHCQLEPTRPTRKWTEDEDKVKALLLEYLTEDIAAPRRVLSVSQAEKIVGRKKFGLSGLADYVASVSSGEKLVIKD